MSDVAYQVFQHYGTNAERLAFTPAPAAGIQPIYIWYATDTSATWLYYTSWVQLTGSGGVAAPASATYITQTANAGLSAEQALSTLVTGLMQVTTATGAITSVTTSAGVSGLISDETGSGAMVFATSPTLVTPALGTPSALVLTNATGLVAAGFATSLFAPRRATVTLTNAQVLALPTTPQTIVAAPGAGFRINSFGFTLHASFAAGAYTNVNGSAFLRFTDGIAGSSYVANDAGGTPVLTDMNSLFGGNVQVVQLLPWQATNDPALEWGLLGDTVATATGDNTAVVLTVDNNAAGNFGGGNAANTMRVIVYYTIEAFP